MKGPGGQAGHVTQTKSNSHTHILGHISFSDQDAVAFGPDFLHMGCSWRRSGARRAHRSLNKPYRVIIMVRPCCRAVGAQERLGDDDKGHLLREGELTELSWLCFRLTNRREALLIAHQSHAEKNVMPSLFVLSAKASVIIA